MAYIYNQTHYRPAAAWAHSYGGSLPDGGPVLGGHDVNGEAIYVGRALESDDVIPGKVVPSHGVCYVSWGGREHGHREYQVLTNPHGCNLVWIQAQGGQVPLGALQAGRQADGEPLYVGRAFHDGSLVLGKVHPSHGTLYVPFGGDELAIKHYEVLCCKEVQL